MNRMKKALASALAVLMLAGLLPAAVFAASSEHNIKDGDVSFGADDCTGGCEGHIVTGTSDSGWNRERNKINISGGTHTIILRDCTIKTPVILGGAGSALDVHNGANVTLVLEGANELHGQGNKPAIWVEPGSTLTIEGTGSLSAYAGGGSAGMGSAAIGSAYGTNTSFGDITIQSGTVYTEGSGGGAGIGGGYELEGGSGSASGNITINGGWVKAIGGESGLGVTGGAGIGSGENADYTGTVTINGGVVYAKGGANSSSIGAGGRGIGERGNGTFSTGENGSAVIVAPQGIGHVAGFPDWDGIFVSYDGQEGTATVGADGAVHLNDSAANIQVWGQPVLDYDLTVDANTTLRVIKNDRNDAPATLTLSAGRTLTNHGEVRVDEGSKVVVQEGAGALNNTGTLWLDNGVVELWGGPSQAQGGGKVLGTGQVRIPLTAGMVQDIPDQTYTGSVIEPGVAVTPQTMWDYTADYASPADYTVTRYENNIDVGTAAAVVKPAVGGLLLDKGEVKKNFEIVPASYKVSVADLAVRTGETDLVTKLRAQASTDVNGLLDKGTFTWMYNGSAVEGGTLKDAAEGTYVVEWTFTLNPGENNYSPSSQSGVVNVKVTAKEVAKVEVAGNEAALVYGDSKAFSDAFGAVTVKDADNGMPVDPNGAISYASADPSVATIGADGTIVSAGVGKTTVTVTVAETDVYESCSTIVNITVSPKLLTVDEIAAVDRPYQGRNALSVQLKCAEHDTPLGESYLLDAKHGVVYNDELHLKAAGTMANAAAGQGKPVTVTEWQLTGDKAGNYILPAAPTGLTVNITKIDATPQNGELAVANELPKTYIFDLTGLHEALPEGYYLGAAEYTAELEDKNGYVESWRVLNDMLIVRMGSVPQGTSGEIAKFTVTTASTNYNDFAAGVVLKAQDEVLGSITLANTVAGSGADKALAFRYTVQLKDEAGEPYTGTVSYEGAGTVAGGQDGIARPDAQGCLTVELAHGQSVTLKGSLQRDKGIAYTVTQQQVPGYAVATVTQEEGGAKTPGTSAGVSGSLALEGVKNVHIAYTNTKQGGGETGGSGSETGGTSTPAQKPNPKTGA